ncbi:RagB/SusD family nutrient uptake outer membrane protein [Sunxiuqinia sp. A32]|uniref:RagB/SusD family nutrient uptake outer membrane protein n=1 Tax=Sunxiuqinia sp. A32 TaxID=3461496 RepID=UPI00404535EB
MKINKTYIFLIIFISGALSFSCSVEPEVYSELLPEEFFNNEAQISAAASAAYTPLYGYWGRNELQDLCSDQSTCPIRSNNGWDDGGYWPRLMRHEFNVNDFVGGQWSQWSGGVSACNRLIEFFSESLGEDTPVVYELRTLRALYFYFLLSDFGNIPIETRFAEADPSPSQVPPQEAFNLIESELKASIDNLTEEKVYAKINKWVGYSILANLYINSERITGTAKWAEAAAAAEKVLNESPYEMEAKYFTNFKVNNEGSKENIFVVPYDRDIAGGFGIRHQALPQSGGAIFGFSPGPWGGFSIQEDFYNAFDENDKRRNSFIAGQQYTVEAQPSYSDELGFYYAAPDDQYKLVACWEDWDNFATTPEIQAQIEDGCSVNITPYYTLYGNRYLYKAGARYGKYEYKLGEAYDMSNDFAIYRYAHIMLLRAEALWRMDNSSVEALSLINQVRERAGVDPLESLTEDDVYWELKKELALENYAREITIRFGHWEDEWFLKDANSNETYKRIYPIPNNQLQSNENLVQNPGY